MGSAAARITPKRCLHEIHRPRGSLIPHNHNKGPAMSATLSRLIMSIATLAGAAFVYLVVCVATIETVGRRYDNLAFLAADVVGISFVTVAWLLIWRSHIQWTTRRMILTACVFFAGLLISAPFAIILGSMIADSFGWFIFAMGWLMVWLFGTAIVWRESAVERAKRLQMMGVSAVVCPTCSYNLTGLKEPNCPECGSRFTLDQLFASQPELAMKADD